MKSEASQVEPAIHRITHLDLRVGAWRWPFATERRNAIDAHFSQMRETRPEIWNGRVLLARNLQISDTTLSAQYFETDFASYLAWRDWGFPDTAVHNGFGMGALRGGDGGFVLGEMAAHTANAGRIYFPSGTPDPQDVRDGQLDIAGSVEREVQEETGITPDEYVPDGHWTCIIAGQRIAMIWILQAQQPADALCARIARHIAAERQPELARAHIVRGKEDLTPAMPDFVAGFITANGAADTE